MVRLRTNSPRRRWAAVSAIIVFHMYIYVPAASLTATAGSQPNIGIGSLIDGTRYYTSSRLIPHLACPMSRYIRVWVVPRPSRHVPCCMYLCMRYSSIICYMGSRPFRLLVHRMCGDPTPAAARYASSFRVPCYHGDDRQTSSTSAAVTQSQGCEPASKCSTWRHGATGRMIRPQEGLGQSIDGP